MSVPNRIAAGSAPGGVVVHIYTARGDLLAASALYPGTGDVDTIATRDAAAADAAELGAAGCVLVAFDGDDGRLMLVARYTEATP